MKVTDIERIIYQLYEIDKLNFNHIAKSLNLSSSAVREKYNKMIRVVKAEQTDPIAQLNIEYSTYKKITNARNRYRERNEELGINLDTIEGLIEAVNDKFETYNLAEKYGIKYIPTKLSNYSRLEELIRITK